jgi:hypothetical protein
LKPFLRLLIEPTVKSLQIAQIELFIAVNIIIFSPAVAYNLRFSRFDQNLSGERLSLAAFSKSERNNSKKL